MARGSGQHWNRVVAAIASIALVVGLMPLPAVAASESESGEPPSDAVPAAEVSEGTVAQADAGEAPEGEPLLVEEEDAEVVAQDEAAEAPAPEAGPVEEAVATQPVESPAFKQNKTIDGVTVTVEADAGAFPEGAKLSVASVPSTATEAAVAPERDAGTNVAVSYTFDIKVLGADGAELQPAGGKSVRVSFAAAEVVDPNLDVSVYHVADGAGAADKLAVSESGSTATATSDGFSYYTVEFTYGDLQYVLQGGESIPLADILAEVGLQGEPESVEVSDPELFSASDATGEWMVTSHKAFSSDEWMRITIAGKPYEIAVTDVQEIVEGGIKYLIYQNQIYQGQAIVLGPDEKSLTKATIFGTVSYDGVDYQVNAIDSNAFKGCASLESVEIPDGVTSIGTGAFYSCVNLESVEIPSGVTSIKMFTFDNCQSLKSVGIPDGVTSIGDSAFASCFSLESVGIPDSVTSIGDSAFFRCESLKNVEIPAGVTSIANSAFAGCISLESVEIPDSVTSIGNGTFNNCQSLESVKIPDSVTSIGEYAFRSCQSLKSVTIPASVQELNYDSFAGCTNLQEFQVSEGNPLFSSEGGFVCSKDETQLIMAPGGLANATVPDGVTSIGTGAFYSCINLKSVTIPDSVKDIGDSAFMECNKLAHIYYCGTGADWNKVTKGNGWDSSTDSDKKVHCLPELKSAVSPDGCGQVTVAADPSAPASPVAGSYWSETDITVTAAPTKGYYFVNWTSEDVQEIDGLTEAEVAFTMPKNNVTVTANFKPKIKLTITAGSASRAYDGTDLTNGGYELTGGALAEGDTVKSVQVEGSQTTVGTSDNVASKAIIVNAGKDVTANYDITYVKGTLTVTPATMTVEAVDYSGKYDGATHEGGATPSVAEGTTVQYSTDGGETWSSTAPGIKDLGTVNYKVKATNPNYNDATDEGALTVTQATATVTITGKKSSVPYDGKKHSVSGYDVDINNKLYTKADFTFSGTAEAKGTKARIYQMGLADGKFENTNPNFDVTFEVTDGSLEIVKAPLTITAIDQEYVYNGETQGEGDTTYADTAVIAEKVKVKGLQGDDELTSITIDGQGQDPGEYELVLSGAAIGKDGDDTDNYEIALVNGTLTISKGVYKVVSGAGATWTKGSGDPLAFVFKCTPYDDTTFEHFTGIQVDGKEVPKEDASGRVNWTAESGSVVVSLQPAYVATLSEGDHTLTALFDDGNNVDVPFKVAAKSPNGKPSNTPKTGDGNGTLVIGLSAAALMALCAMAAYVVRRRRDS